MNNKKGFTLLEVIIATGIMVSALSMLVFGIIQCFILTETTRNMDIALNAAYYKLEEIATSDLTDIMDNYDDQNFDVAGLTPAGAGSVGVIETIPEELYEVIVTVFWQQRQGRQMARTLKTTLVNK